VSILAVWATLLIFSTAAWFGLFVVAYLLVGVVA
jgi:hypothetical protein